MVGLLESRECIDRPDTVSNDNFSFTMPLDSGASSRTGTPRYLAPPFDARMVDGGQALLLLHGEHRLRRLPVQLAQVLGQCNRFRTADEHLGEVARALRVPAHQTSTIRQALERLIADGLLRSEAGIVAQLRQQRSSDPEPPAISCLFVRTCARPDTLDRLLTSLVRQPLPAGLEHVVVLDDDAHQESRRSTRSVVEHHRPHLGGRLTLIDREARRDILERIARGAGTDADRLRWSIEGDPDDTDPSYGAGLNFALLAGAGRLIAIIDDDATLEACALPGCDDRPAIRRRQSARLHFPDPDGDLPQDHYRPLDVHPVDLHARLLGTGTARLAELGSDDLPGLVEDLDPQMLSELCGDNRVRLTSSGTLGDPGTGGVQWLFTEPPEHLTPLCESEERYRALLGQRRMARCAGRPEVTTAFALMTTTMTGIDNRDLLLPTQPKGSNEDLLFGALTAYLHPGALQANLPHMLYHMRPEPRRWQSADIERAREVNRAGFLASRVHALQTHAPFGDSASRASLLIETFRNLARAQHDERAWQLNQELLEIRSQTVEQATAVRERLKPPPWLDRDFARAIEHNGRIDRGQQDRIAEIAAGLPRFLECYADAIEDWRETWHYCQATGIDALLEARP